MIEKLKPGASRVNLEPQPHEDYGRLSIDLATARNNEVINIQGDYIAKIKYDGTATGCYFKIDHRHAAKIYAKEFKSLQRRYARLFLTNTAQAGKVLVIQINETEVSVITPELDTGKLSEIEVAVEAIETLQGVDGGGDLQKVKEELELIKTAVEIIDDSIKAEDTAASSGDKGVMALAVREDTDTVMAGITGDYIPLSVDPDGHLRTHDKDALAQMVTDNAVLDTIDADTGAIKTAVEIMDDWDDADHAKVVPPLMSSDLLESSADAGTDTIAAPGAGYALEVLGYQVTESVNVALVMSVSAKLKFETSGKQLWAGVYEETGTKTAFQNSSSNIRVRGNENEALTLTNADRTAGGSTVSAVVFYRTVAV